MLYIILLLLLIFKITNNFEHLADSETMSSYHEDCTGDYKSRCWNIFGGYCSCSVSNTDKNPGCGVASDIGKVSLEDGSCNK